MMMVIFLAAPPPPSDACASRSAAARAHAPTAPQPAASPCSQSTGSAHSGCGTRSGAASWAPEPPSATRSRSSGPGTASPCEVSDTRRPREDGAPGTGPRSAATADLGTGPGARGEGPRPPLFLNGGAADSFSVRADRATPEGLRPGRAKQPGAAEPLRPVGVEADLALPVEPLVLGRQAVPEAASRFVLLGAPGVSYVADPDPPPPEVSIPADRPPPHPPRPASWGNRSAHGHVCARKEVSRRFP